MCGLSLSPRLSGATVSEVSSSRRNPANTPRPDAQCKRNKADLARPPVLLSRGAVLMTPWLDSDPVWGQIAACILFAREPCPKPSQGYNKSRRSSSTPRTVLMLAASPSMAHRSKQSSYVFTERISIKKNCCICGDRPVPKKILFQADLHAGRCASTLVPGRLREGEQRTEGPHTWSLLQTPAWQAQ